MTLTGMSLVAIVVVVTSLLGKVKGQISVTQTELDRWAEDLDVRWAVVTNTREVERFQASLTLTNRGSLALSYGNWSLYLYSVYTMEPEHLQRTGMSYKLPEQGLQLTFVQGMLYKITPTPDFRPLLAGGKRVLRLRMKFWSVARTDLFPNWFLTGPAGTEPRILRSTQGDDLDFVAPFADLSQQKRYDFDAYAARTAQERYDRNFVPFPGDASEVRVVPRPHQLSLLGGAVQLTQSWRIYDASLNGQLANEVAYLQGKLSYLSIVNTSSEPVTHVIKLSTGTVVFDGNSSTIISDSDDSYFLRVNSANSSIDITGKGASGVLYGIQTLLALLRDTGTVPAVLVRDAPRFRFRGLFLDLSRNFRTAEEIERVMEAMVVYKMNKLHLHLADDEGWRIDIEGLPELTSVGAKRCYDLQEVTCLLPQLGSGPYFNNSGSGYLSGQQYQRLLATANRLHIEVIPEIEMPGHARAAIKAMEARYRRLLSENATNADYYRLIEEGDPSVYTSPQAFDDNAINVCRNSTYQFISKVVEEIQKLHEPIQPLKEFHYGGDEVGRGAWVNSSLCQQLQMSDSMANHSLKQYFFKRVASITHRLGLAVGGWEDGLMLQGNEPFDRSMAENPEVYANVWDNVWEWGTSSRTYTLANKNFLVIMSHATHLYFDHPSEPHPEERGYYWATRFTDTQKVFGFMPMSYYDNIEETNAGLPLSRADVCGDKDENCPRLLKPQNIVGMQGNLWAEAVRTSEQAEGQLFPRLLALAERSWHQAAWESETNVTLRLAARRADWYSFARAVGHRELPRLDKMGIRYRVPPPGAKVDRQRLFVATTFPGLAVEYQKDGSDIWVEADGTERIKDEDRLRLRTRSSDGQRYSRVVEFSPVPRLPATSQKTLEYIGSSLNVHFEVVDNYQTYGTDFYVAKITLNNTGATPIPASNWALYFPSVQWVQDPQVMMQGRDFVLQEYKMAVSHVQGYLFRLAPVPGFVPLGGGESRDIVFKIQYWSVSRYEQFPNYFVAADGANGVTINNTASESLDFVADFRRVNQWKRDAADRFDPWTPGARYDREADTHDLGTSPLPYLPTPLQFQMDREKRMSLDSEWVIAASSQLAAIAAYLTDYLNGTGRTVLTVQTAPKKQYISLELGPVDVAGSEAYSLTVSPDEQTVKIVGKNSSGVLYGVQSLINMMLQSDDGATLFSLSALDAPRFAYRGMYLDVARNFHSKAGVLKLLEAMGLYKLNKLHLHLSDDEGWRLQIPGLEELTQVGSTRCYDPSEEICLTPVLGSGPTTPNSGTGFYTEDDYKEILAFAAVRHIEVIPEFDMPGHAHAAIKAMQLRRRLRWEAGDVNASQFSLDEAGDQSLYSSIQMFDDNAVNPCLDSTFAFIAHVMEEVKRMHNGVNPLRTYHFGGDEVAAGAWQKSDACEPLVQKGDNLKHVFNTRVAKIAASLGLHVQAWEDGLMNGTTPFPLEDMATEQVFVNAWDNVWEWGSAARAYTLANLGYKVIMSQATHMYFDHPQEPSPEERGFYWATRYTDTKKAFYFQPDDLWANVDITRFGEPLTLSTVCGDNNVGCPSLLKRENVVGMQGHLWSETVRTIPQMQYMIFPRLLALAERAWHRAQWEEAGQGHLKQGNWIQFANALGHAHLGVLDRLGIAYRVPPPGAKSVNAELKTNTQFPGLKVEYKTDGSEWVVFNSDSTVLKDGQTVWLRTRSASGSRYSSPVEVQVHFSVVTSGSPGGQRPVYTWINCLSLCAILVVCQMLVS